MRRNMVLSGLAVCALPLAFSGLLTGAVADLRVSDVSSSTAFEWDAVAGADRYVVHIGSAAGGKDILRRGSSGTSLVAQQLPVDGSTLHATLHARVDGRWSRNATLAFDTIGRPLIHRPSLWTYTGESPVLQGSVARFAWSQPTGNAASRFVVMAGTADDPDAFARRAAVAGDQFVSLGGLPLDGSQILVTLLWRDSQGRWRREKPVEYQASAEPFVQVPTNGSQLSGSSAKLKLAYIDGLVTGSGIRLRVRMGTPDSSAAYGIWNPVEGNGRSRNVFLTAGLPTDGSAVVATPQVFDGRRWTFYKPVQFVAANPSSRYLWGDCSSAEQGRRLPRSVMIGNLDGKLYRLLSDGCASDRDYVVEPDFGLSLRGGTPTGHVKGVLLWLAPDSGPGKVTVLTRDNEHTTRSQRRALRTVPPASDIAAPVYVSLASDSDAVEGFGESYYEARLKYLSFSSLDSERPVKVSEIRLVRGGDDVSSLRRTGLSDSTRDYVSNHNGGFDPHFAAMRDDPRARVTAEINALFGPAYSTYIGVYAANIETCGLYRWVDATGVIDKGIEIDGDPLDPYSPESKIHGTTAWINWDLVSNKELVAALNQSVESGINASYYGCTPDSAGADTEIDWMAKVAAALAGTYEGPTVNFDW